MGKAAAAAGAVASFAVPAAEAALGESAYVGLLHLHGALAAAAADEGRPMKVVPGRNCSNSPSPHSSTLVSYGGQGQGLFINPRFLCYNATRLTV